MIEATENVLGAIGAVVAAPGRPQGARRYKIALVVPGGVDRSGEHRVIPVLLSLIERLTVLHEVHVFALQQELEPGRWTLCGAQVHNAGGLGARERFWRTSRALWQEHRRGAFDVFHALWSGSSGAAAVLAATLLRTPSLVHLTGGELLALKDIGYGGRLSWRGRWREAWVLSHASRLTATSETMLRQLAALGHKAQRLPLGVDQKFWLPRAPQPRQPGQPLRLVHVASLNRVKDPFMLLQALALLVRAGLDFRLTWIGEDTLGGAVQRRAAELGLLLRIEFVGFMTQKALQPALAQADLLVLSSRHEAGPAVLLEAALMGLPCVGTAVGHVEEWAPEAALAVPVGDAMALADAIVQLAHDEPARLRLALAAQRRSQLEDADHTASWVLRLYDELAEGR